MRATFMTMLRTAGCRGTSSNLPFAAHRGHLRATQPFGQQHASAFRILALGKLAEATPLHTVRRFQSSEGYADHYATLGVKSTASQDEIKAAYKKLALQYHPDRNRSPGAEEKFKMISAAYGVVGNKQKRAEYDGTRQQRTDFTGTRQSSSMGGHGHGGFPGGFAHAEFQQMSKEDADRLFRDIFGGVRIDQIFREFEEETRRSASSPNRGVNFREFHHSQRMYRPSFHSTATNVFVDDYGNRMEERVFSNSAGTRFTVRSTTSSHPNASNTTAEEYYHANASQTPDGRFHFGNASFNLKPRGVTQDFGQETLGIRTHGRHPLVAIMIVVAWGVIICTLVTAIAMFFLAHPLFTFSVLLLIVLRRLRVF